MYTDKKSTLQFKAFVNIFCMKYHQIFCKLSLYLHFLDISMKSQQHHNIVIIIIGPRATVVKLRIDIENKNMKKTKLFLAFVC